MARHESKESMVTTLPVDCPELQSLNALITQKAMWRLKEEIVRRHRATAKHPTRGEIISEALMEFLPESMEEMQLRATGNGTPREAVREKRTTLRKSA